ncbi:hypothetical protein ACEUZ9_000312 [Paracoccus litorisediminis]|uniref:hypothetical protein n=1 Tax=Paracoccus litorisediminis TaxID=2006130 RepID=UPI00372F9B49
MKLPSIPTFDKHMARVDWRRSHGETTFNRFAARGKPKLHGVSMAVMAQRGSCGVKVSSRLRRNTELTDLVAPGYSSVRQEIEETLWAGHNLAYGTTGIFAEWAGPGIQKKDAVTRIDRPRLFVFAAFSVNFGKDARLLDRWSAGEDVDTRELYGRISIVTDPGVLSRILNPCPHVEIIPWVTGELRTDGASDEQVETVMREVNDIVDAYAREDGYILDRFGISGPGEGVVIQPVSQAFNQATMLDLSELSWKAKTDHHAVKKVSAPATRAVEIPAGLPEFIETFVTPARIEQMISENFPDGPIDSKGTGRFVTAMRVDVMKESIEERQALGLDDVRIVMAIEAAARQAWKEAMARLPQAEMGI